MDYWVALVVIHVNPVMTTPENWRLIREVEPDAFGLKAEAIT